MKHVSIVIPQGAAVLESIVRVFTIFDWVNDYLTDNGEGPLFDLHLVGMAPRADLYRGIFSVMPDLTLTDAPTFDLIIIPALAGDISEGLKRNAAFIPWMKKQYKMGAGIAGLCTGAFLLAATGLMDGNKPTHWFVAADCRNAFCQIKLRAKRMIMKERRIHTRRGAYSSLNVLIENFAGAGVAMACSKIFETDFNRECQSVVIIFNKQKRHKSRRLEGAQEFVDNDLRGKISREQFARMFTLTRRDRKRSFENSTTHTLLGDMQTIKLEAIQKRLEASYGNNTQGVMPEVCYNNSMAFRRIFNKRTEF
jgi:transcriptional regulator GlxA family with amidase domain